MTDSRRRTGLHTFDLRGMNPEHRHTVQQALNACTYPFIRIRRATGKRVPVTVADTSRYVEHTGTADGQAWDAFQDEARQAALGLYWLPTAEHPAGRVELSTAVMDDVPLAQEVFLAEAAHAVDYGAMTDAQRQAVFTALHGGDPTPHGTHGWWEERGGRNYWSDWTGEVFMAAFARAFAPTLPRPLEARQPWAHKVTDEMAAQVRAVLG